MFQFLFYFCSNQSIYKSLIYSTYQEFIVLNKKFQKIYKRCEPYIDIKNYNSITYQLKYELKEIEIKQYKKLNELIKIIKIYCKKYPNEKIAKYQHFKTYDQYPYRLYQNIEEFISLL